MMMEGCSVVMSLAESQIDVEICSRLPKSLSTSPLLSLLGFGLVNITVLITDCPVSLNVQLLDRSYTPVDSTPYYRGPQ